MKAFALLLLLPLVALAQDAPPSEPQPVIEQAAEVLAEPASQEAKALAAEVRAGEQADAKIASAVTARLLRHPRLQQVTVEVNSGIVTLGGEVLADADRDTATTVAKSVGGVGDVVNQVGISASRWVGCGGTSAIRTWKAWCAGWCSRWW